MYESPPGARSVSWSTARGGRRSGGGACDRRRATGAGGAKGREGGRLEIKVFGALRVQRPGRPVTQFQTKRVKDLFSYLLIHRHTLHPREALAELFWDGTKENNPRHCLNTALWRLQRVLGEPEPGGHRYLLVDA